jgi:hypothetical protein
VEELRPMGHSQPILAVGRNPRGILFHSSMASCRDMAAAAFDAYDNGATLASAKGIRR